MADYVVGVSAGIAYGVSYVSKQPRRNLEILTRFVNDRRYMGAEQPGWTGTTAATSVWSSPTAPFPTSWCPLTTRPMRRSPATWRPGHQPGDRPGRIQGGHHRGQTLPASSRPPVPCPSCSRCSTWTASPIWTGVRPRCGALPPGFEQGCDRVVVILTKPRSFVRSRKGSSPDSAPLPGVPQLLPHHGGAAGAGQPEPCGAVPAGEGGQGPGHRPQHPHGVGRIEHNVDKLRMLWAEGLSAGHGEHGADPILHGSMTGPSPGASRAKASSISPQQGEEGGHPLQLLPGAAMSQRGGGRRRSRDQRAGGQRKDTANTSPWNLCGQVCFLCTMSRHRIERNQK